LLAVTPADELGARAADPFCGSGVLGAINELADFSHSKAIADLISDNNKAKDRLILTLGKIGPPRYANFIGRWREDPEPRSGAPWRARSGSSTTRASRFPCSSSCSRAAKSPRPPA